MNDAHLHLLVNHFPIIGLFFGIAILLYGIFKKNPLLLNIAYVIFIFCMVTGKISMMTGEKAEDIVENLGISHDLIHEHEELAEGFMKVIYLLGLASVLGLVANKRRHPKALLVSYLVLVLGVVGIVLSSPVGNSGGEIRHTEIRKDETDTTNQTEKNQSENEED